MTLRWNEVTNGWNEVTWNEVTMERSDRIPWGTTNSLMLVFKFAYVGEFTIRRRRVGVGEYARRRVDRIPFIVVERSNDITHVKLLPSLVAKISDICDVNVNRLSSIACCVILRTFCPN